MADSRRHRGPHPEDAALFGTQQRPRLGRAFADLCWLLDRGYAVPSSLKLVGDRHNLTARQRTALERCACTAKEAAGRQSRQIALADLNGKDVALDGYNVLTTVEAALANGLLLLGRDGALRDMASMHGSYRKVAETDAALEAIGRTLHKHGVAACRWYLDRPVSNSGRLKRRIEQIAALHGWAWTVELVFNPDATLAQIATPVASADSGILDLCQSWVNLARYVVESQVLNPWILDLWRAGGGQEDAKTPAPPLTGGSREEATTPDADGAAHVSASQPQGHPAAYRAAGGTRAKQ